MASKGALTVLTYTRRAPMKVQPISNREILYAFNALGSLSAIRKRLFSLAADPSTTTTNIAEIVAQDPSLTMRVISKARDGSNFAMHNIITATQHISIDDTMHIVHKSCDRDIFDNIDPCIVDFLDYWSHSVCCALAASAIARRLSISDPSSMYTMGLLHDVGTALLYLLRPRNMARLLEDNAIEWTQKEHAELGIDHAEVASMLLQRFGFPDRTCEAVRFHHEPSRARSHSKEVYILHVAEAIAQEVKPGWKTGVVRDAMLAVDTTCSSHIPNYAEIIKTVRQEVSITFDYVLDLIQPGTLSEF